MSQIWVKNQLLFLSFLLPNRLSNKPSNQQQTVSDLLLSICSDAQSILEDVIFVPTDCEAPDYLDETHGLLNKLAQGGKGRAAALSLLFYLLPTSGEPVAFNANQRLTNLRGITATTQIAVANSNQMMEINFVKSLLQDEKYNYIGNSGTNPMHYFAASVERKKHYPRTNKELLERKDECLQTWMLINFHKAEMPDPALQAKQLVIVNQGVRDVTVEDINRLHYVLNIPHYYKPASINKEGQDVPVVFFQAIFDKLKDMPLHNAELLFNFITGPKDLGIPLFERSDSGTPPPIYEQWTKLSYFLQMCSPICLSPIEGGHRTLQLIKFFTGAEFTDNSPQPFTPIERLGYPGEIKPNLSNQ